MQGPSDRDATIKEMLEVYGSGSAPKIGLPTLGQRTPGNINLYNRPDVEGSTVRSMSFAADGQEILIPTVVGGKLVSDDDAIRAYEKSGEHLGIFDTPDNATAYAKALHDAYESGTIPLPPVKPAADVKTPAALGEKDVIKGEERSALITQMLKQYAPEVFPGYEPERGMVGKAWDATWTPPEAVTNWARETADEHVGSLADAPPSQVLKDGEWVENPEFARFRQRAYSRGFGGGILEAGAGFMSPGVIASTLLGFGSWGMSAKAIRTFSVGQKALAGGTATAAQQVAMVEAFRKAAQSATFWNKMQGLSSATVGTGFGIEGSKMLGEGIGERDPLKAVNGAIQIMIAGGAFAHTAKTQVVRPPSDGGGGGGGPPFVDPPKGNLPPAVLRETPPTLLIKPTLPGPPKPKATGAGARLKAKLGKPPPVDVEISAELVKAETTPPAIDKPTPPAETTVVQQYFYHVQQNDMIKFVGTKPPTDLKLLEGEAVVGVDNDGLIKTELGDPQVAPDLPNDMAPAEAAPTEAELTAAPEQINEAGPQGGNFEVRFSDGEAYLSQVTSDTQGVGQGSAMAERIGELMAERNITEIDADIQSDNPAAVQAIMDRAQRRAVKLMEESVGIPELDMDAPPVDLDAAGRDALLEGVTREQALKEADYFRGRIRKLEAERDAAISDDGRAQIQADLDYAIEQRADYMRRIESLKEGRPSKPLEDGELTNSVEAGDPETLLEDRAIANEEAGPIEGEGRRLVFKIGKQTHEGVAVGRGTSPGTVSVLMMLDGTPINMVHAERYLRDRGGTDTDALIRPDYLPEMATPLPDLIVKDVLISSIIDAPSEAPTSEITEVDAAVYKPPPLQLSEPPAPTPASGLDKPPAPEPTVHKVVASRAPRKRAAAFNPLDPKKDHSLADFARAQGIARVDGKVPQEFLHAIGENAKAAAQFFPKDSSGFEGADLLLIRAIEEGRFALDPEMNTTDFLVKIAEDYMAKPKPNAPGRTYSSLSNMDKGDADYAQIMQEWDADIKAREAELEADLEAEQNPTLFEGDGDTSFDFGTNAPAEYLITFEDGTSVTVKGADSKAAARASVEESDPPSQVKTVELLMDPTDMNMGPGDVIDFLRPKSNNHDFVNADAAYQELLKARKARAMGPNFGARQLEMLRTIPEAVIRRLLNKRYDWEVFVGEMIKDAEGRAIAGDFEAAMALEQYGTPETDPRMLMDINIGGTIGRIQVAALELDGIRRAVEAQDLTVEFTHYLEHRAWRRNYKIIEEKLAKVRQASIDSLHAGDHVSAEKFRAKVTEYERRITDNEIVPTGKSLPEIEQAIADLEVSLGFDPANPDYIPPKLSFIRAMADRYFQDNARYWKLLYDYDVITKAVYDQGRARGIEYIPLDRIHEAFQGDPNFGGLGGLTSATRDAVKAFEGSSLASLNPLEAAYIWRTRAVLDVARNESLKGVFRSRELAPEGLGQFVITLRDNPNVDAARKLPRGYTKFSYYEKGQKRSFGLPGHIGAGLTATSAGDITAMNLVARAGQKALHVGAIGWNFAFALPNVFKDVGRGMLVSKAVEPFNPKDVGRFAGAWGKALRSVMTNSPEYQEYLWSRASGGTLAKTISPQYWLAPDWLRKGHGTVLALPGQAARGIPKLINILEETTKAAGYLRLREKGMGKNEAAAETRSYVGTPDARKGGFDSGVINMAMMFWNVRQQGRLFALKGYKRDPKRLLQALMAAALPAMALYKWNSRFRDDKGEPEIQHVPRHVRRDNFVWFSEEINKGTGRYLYYTIPIPHEMKWAWIPMNDALNDYGGEFEVKTSDYVQGFASAISASAPLVPELDVKSLQMGRSFPLELARSMASGLNPVAGIPFEQMSNLDFHRNIPIEGRADQNIAPEERFNARTSPTAVVMGQAMPEGMGTLRSPKRIEHVFRSFGGAAEMGLKLIDPLSSFWSPQPELPPQPGASAFPPFDVIKRRFVGTGYRDQVVEDYETQFYHYYGEAATIAATYRAIAERGPEGEIRAEEWLQADPQRVVLLGEVGQIRMIRETLKGLSDEKQKVMNALGMDEDERLQHLYELVMAQGQVLEGAQEIREKVDAARAERRVSRTSAPE